MECYRILYRIRVVHDYFGNKPCTAIQCRPAPRCESLMRRRDILFRQHGVDEWIWLYSKELPEDDVLQADLFLTDSAFPLYTEWDGFQPSAAYRLELPLKEDTVEVDTIHLSDRRRSAGSGFCSVLLRLTDRVLQAAEAGAPLQTILHFQTPAMQWEYIFIPHEEDETAAPCR